MTRPAADDQSHVDTDWYRGALDSIKEQAEREHPSYSQGLLGDILDLRLVLRGHEDRFSARTRVGREVRQMLDELRKITGAI